MLMTLVVFAKTLRPADQTSDFRWNENETKKCLSRFTQVCVSRCVVVPIPCEYLSTSQWNLSQRYHTTKTFFYYSSIATCMNSLSIRQTNLFMLSRSESQSELCTPKAENYLIYLLFPQNFISRSNLWQPPSDTFRILMAQVSAPTTREWFFIFKCTAVVWSDNALKPSDEWTFRHWKMFLSRTIR